MRHRWLVGAVVLGLLTLGGMPGAVASQRLPNGSSTLDVPTITVDVFTGTPDTFDDEVSLTNGESGALIAINFTFPAGVTLTDAAIDTGASSCSDEVGTVTRSGNTVKIADIACANGQELAVEKPDVFRDDPVRLIRVFRHCQQLGCKPDFHLTTLIHESLPLITPAVTASADAEFFLPADAFFRACGFARVDNFEALIEMKNAVPLPVIASGGVCTLDHVRRLSEDGIPGCIIGRALYEGSLDLASAVALARSRCA